MDSTQFCRGRNFVFREGKDKKCSGNDHAPYGFSSAAFFA